MKASTKTRLYAYALLSPALALLAVFILYPLANVIWMSFHKWPIFGKPSWVGFKNFQSVLTDPGFWYALKFTFAYALLVTPMLMALAFVSALVCNAKMFGTTFFRSVFFLPVVMSFATAAFVWLWLYSELYGVITYLLRWLDGDLDQQLNVFTTGNSATLAVSVMVTWKFAGISMIIILAGMQSIRDDLYESAKLMGATRLHMAWHITLPLLRRTLALAMILSLAGSLQAYEQFAIMTGGGPANATRTIMMLTIDTAFDFFKIGPASAMSILLMLIVFVITLLQLRVAGRSH